MGRKTHAQLQAWVQPKRPRCQGAVKGVGSFHGFDQGLHGTVFTHGLMPCDMLMSWTSPRICTVSAFFYLNQMTSWHGRALVWPPERRVVRGKFTLHKRPKEALFHARIGPGRALPLGVHERHEAV